MKKDTVMTTEEKAKAYDEALEQAKRELKTCGSLDCDAARQIFRFFPQLKESEDERIRKEIIHYILYKADGVSEKQEHEWVAYLEKQKEPHYTKRNALFDKCVENCDPEVMKRVSDEIDEMLEKKQKPDEIDGKALLHVSNKSYDIGFRDGVASVKPAEWSDEDKNKVDVIIRLVEQGSGWPDRAIKEYVNWFKSLRMPPKQEWSKEDEMYLSQAIETLEHENYSILADKLKSLRPQYHGDVTMTEAYKMGLEAGKASSWKPSEQEKSALGTAISILTEERNFPRAAAHLQAILDAFEDKESRKDWKPSEEQMTRLNECVIEARERHSASTSSYERYRILNSLYNDLKKLI